VSAVGYLDLEINKMFAVLDIETTGGKFNEEGITEIAIYRFDGSEIVDQFSSLVNPEREIQPFVQKLTGINSKMLQSAPRFFEIAKRIIELTEGCVLVAHNAEFDYRILRTEFRRLGYTYNRESVCTVTLSQTLLPEQESFKLGKLVRSLGIPISDRHRAQGDAIATLKLFKLLLEKDSKKEIVNAQTKSLHKKDIAPKFHKTLDKLPTETGVYYIYGQEDEIIYIGKSNNIRKRVNSHLTGKSSKSARIKQQLKSVRFEKTGSEFIALLKEQHEIKVNKPDLNKVGKYRMFPMGIRIETDEKGYQKLILEQTLSKFEYIKVFRNKKTAVGQLFYWLSEYALCQNKSSLSNNKEQCPRRMVQKCDGSCEGIIPAEEYNSRIEKLLSDLVLPLGNKLYTTEGRQDGEYGFIYLEDAVIKGYGYYDLNYQITTSERISNRLIPIESNPDSQALVHRFIRNKKYHKLIDVNDSLPEPPKL